MANQYDKDYSPVGGEKPNAGPFLARVVGNTDATYMGILEVEILRQSGTDTTPTSLLQAKYMNPFYGVSNVAFNSKDPNDYNNTQKSYGMWFVPPDVGSIVIVTMINGNPKYAFWMGCVMDQNMNFMVPGIAATQQIVDGDGSRQPAAEYNKLVTPSVGDPEQIKKPLHPFAATLAAQGLAKDDIRGTTTSSARRESPSAVFGISTPGPLDKSASAKKAQIGKPGSQINAFVSRLGGSTFVMDDGDAAFLRKGKPGETAPVYASVEQGDTDGDTSIPHNELVRIRTRTGHQILLHNSEDLIYIGNARGTAWIELTSNGKIDIYAADSISMHTKGDYNVTADGDINLTAAGTINLNAGDAFKATAGGNYEIKAGADGKLTAGGNTNINSGGNHLETAAAIHMNGPGAASASSATKATRIPQAEPWSGHENLHNTALAPSTTTDTFMKVRE